MGIKPLLKNTALLAVVAMAIVTASLIAYSVHGKPVSGISVQDTPSPVSSSISVVASDAAGFTPNVIRLKYGETVTIELSTSDEPHTFTLPDYGVNQIIPSGKTVELVLRATKKGEFTFFCSTPCGMMHNSGVLIVS